MGVSSTYSTDNGAGHCAQRGFQLAQQGSSHYHDIQ